MKTTSRFAIAATASIMMGGLMAPANAADLGGHCCADLEERIAELEATTVRKGNRKVSLTLSGHVNEAILFWDDGVEQNAYIGTSNYSRTRFRFRGSAKINTHLTASYYIEIGVRRDSFVVANQTSDSGNTSLDIRHQVLYLEHKRLGQISIGHSGTATEGITEINLGGTLASGNDPEFTHGLTFLTRINGVFAGPSWGALNSPQNSNVGEGDRLNRVLYVSPTLAGFTFSTAFGEDDFYDVALRYAGEWNGVRFAAGIGYQQWSDTERNCEKIAQVGPTVGASDGSNSAGIECDQLGMSASIMHVPTGLYVSGSYGRGTDDLRVTTLAATTPGGAAAVDDEDEHYYIAAGIAKNFFGIGKTTFQVDYFKADAGTHRARNGSIGSFTIASSEYDVIGFSFQQNIDAAAMQLYVGYHHFSGSITGGTDAPTAGGLTTNGTSVDVDDFDTVIVGARIQF
ncbi:MAG: hypothetical protein AAFR04_09295 [Pseudomonadota bacterium]